MWVSELPFVFICVISFHSFLLFLALLSTTLDQVYLPCHLDSHSSLLVGSLPPICYPHPNLSS